MEVWHNTYAWLGMGHEVNNLDFCLTTTYSIKRSNDCEIFFWFAGARSPRRSAVWSRGARSPRRSEPWHLTAASWPCPNTLIRESVQSTSLQALTLGRRKQVLSHVRKMLSDDMALQRSTCTWIGWERTDATLYYVTYLDDDDV